MKEKRNKNLFTFSDEISDLLHCLIKKIAYSDNSWRFLVPIGNFYTFLYGEKLCSTLVFSI